MESEIRWLPLRLNVLPLVDKQARAVMQLYLATRREIMEGDILSIQRLLAIKQEIAARLAHIDAFYARNALDSRAKYLYATRSLLAKILDQRNDFENISDFTSNDPLATLQTPKKSTFREEQAVVSTTTRRNQPSQLTLNHRGTSRSPLQNSEMSAHLTEATRDPKVMRLSDLKKEPKSKTPVSVREPVGTGRGEKGSSRKLEQGTSKKGTYKKIEEVGELEREKLEMSSRLERSPYDINKSFKDLSELVFTIKMTKEEYNEFMRLKRKNNHA